MPHLDEAPPTSSFPSGHTAAAVCFYGSIAAIILWHSRHRWIKVVAVVICAAVPLMIAGSRVYRGMHYPTDVLAGLLLGAIWLTVVILYVRTHDAGGRRTRPSTPIGAWSAGSDARRDHRQPGEGGRARTYGSRWTRR